MTKTIMTSMLAVTIAAGFASSVEADDFRRTATWPVYLALPADLPSTTETAAEIVTSARGGNLLIFSDSPGKALGFVDIADLKAPKSAGRLALDGEPTSVAVKGETALVAINTSKSFAEPSGYIGVVGIGDHVLRARCDVKGQPDSAVVSPDGRYLAVAIENERDEKLNKGAIPQLPAGHLAIFTLDSAGMPTNCNAATIVPMTGLAEVAPEDPEPEYVAINGNNVAAVTLQENNHIVLVDLASGKVTGHFSAGTVSLDGVDTKTDKIISATGSLKDIKREPDAIAWIGNDRLVTADEGDYQGGSRGFTIFDLTGKVLHASGTTMEHLAMRIGHYPEKRARAKGVEPEAVAVATYGSETLIFVGAERANMVAVYRDRGRDMAPEFVQVLPTGVGPEGVLPIPERGVLAVASETDKAKSGVRSNISLYQLMPNGNVYPTVMSNDVGGVPLAWGALSGLTPDPKVPGRLYAVPDSFYADSRIFTIDATTKPARITAALPLMMDGKQASYDLEGVARAADGGFWLVSEGNPDNKKDNLLIRVAPDGKVLQEIKLPDSVNAQAVRFGFEGVAVTGSGADERVYVCFQREWKDDAKGQVKIGLYEPAKQAWSFARYPLDPEVPADGWIGLSEIAPMPDGRFAILERDNQGGPTAKVKRVYAIDLRGVAFAPAGKEPPLVKKSLLRDILPDLQLSAGWTSDKPEGLTIAPDGTLFLVTDSDGIDDATGETQFLNLGKIGG